MAKSFFSFIISGQECAVDTDRVVEVLDDAIVTPLPLSPGFITGVSNFRGNLVGVVDLAFYLGQGGASTENVIIICSSPEGPVAFIVDSIRDIITPEKILTADEMGSEINLPYFLGVVVNEKGLIRLLDIDSITQDINNKTEGKTSLTVGSQQ